MLDDGVVSWWMVDGGVVIRWMLIDDGVVILWMVDGGLVIWWMVLIRWCCSHLDVVFT